MNRTPQDSQNLVPVTTRTEEYESSSETKKKKMGLNRRTQNATVEFWI